MVAATQLQLVKIQLGNSTPPDNEGERQTWFISNVIQGDPVLLQTADAELLLDLRRSNHWTEFLQTLVFLDLVTLPLRKKAKRFEMLV